MPNFLHANISTFTVLSIVVCHVHNTMMLIKYNHIIFMVEFEDSQYLCHIDTGKEYVKVILHNSRMVGAILIGETDLEVSMQPF